MGTLPSSATSACGSRGSCHHQVGAATAVGHVHPDTVSCGRLAIGIERVHRVACGSVGPLTLLLAVITSTWPPASSVAAAQGINESNTFFRLDFPWHSIRCPVLSTLIACAAIFGARNCCNRQARLRAHCEAKGQLCGAQRVGMAGAGGNRRCTSTSTPRRLRNSEHLCRGLAFRLWAPFRCSVWSSLSPTTHALNQALAPSQHEPSVLGRGHAGSMPRSLVDTVYSGTEWFASIAAPPLRSTYDFLFPPLDLLDDTRDAAAVGRRAGSIPPPPPTYDDELDAWDSFSDSPWSFVTSRYTIALVAVAIVNNRIQHICRPRGAHAQGCRSCRGWRCDYRASCCWRARC